MDNMNFYIIKTKEGFISNNICESAFTEDILKTVKFRSLKETKTYLDGLRKKLNPKIYRINCKLEKVS